MFFQVVGWQLGMEQSAANPRQYSLSLEVRQSDTSHDKSFGNNFDLSSYLTLPLKNTLCLATVGWPSVP